MPAALFNAQNGCRLPAATNVPKRPVGTLNGHRAAAGHAHRTLTIDTAPDSRLVVVAIDAALHDHRFLVVICAIPAMIRGSIAVASIVRTSAVAPAAMAVATIVG